jgi:Family of unknown function (DUF6325)
MTDASNPLGPVSYLIVEFPGNKMTGDGLPLLVDLVDRGVIRILDLLFVMRGEDGTTAVVEVTDLDGDGELDLAIFEGASSGLLGETDAAEAGQAIEPGSSAAVLLFENRWAAPFVQALRDGGAEVVAAGYVPQDELLSTLDDTEA